MNNYDLNNLLKKHNKQYYEFWREILEPNQREINNITDFTERKILQATQDKIAVYINEQSDLIEFLIKELNKAPTIANLEYYKRYAKQARYYISTLGGNPSILNYITDADLC
jgi:hypothetical protein